MSLAFTRPVSTRIGACELTHLDRAPIDAVRAAAQHRTYEAAIVAAGFDVVQLPALDDHPDAVFVEDTAIMLGEHAVITRPGAASRRAEADNTAAALADRFTVHRLTRGAIDGGDVLRIGRTIYVGLSQRTDCAGIVALANVAAPLGFEVVPVPHEHCLHLKTGATWIGHDAAGRPTVLVNEQWIDPSIFTGVTTLAVSPDEPFAANGLRIADTLIFPNAYPETSESLRSRGFKLHEIDVSELEKAEAGLTCMSLLAEPID